MRVLKQKGLFPISKCGGDGRKRAGKSFRNNPSIDKHETQTDDCD